MIRVALLDKSTAAPDIVSIAPLKLSFARLLGYHSDFKKIDLHTAAQQQHREPTP